MLLRIWTIVTASIALICHLGVMYLEIRQQVDKHPKIYYWFMEIRRPVAAAAITAFICQLITTPK